jgi:hypothetical protein
VVGGEFKLFPRLLNQNTESDLQQVRNFAAELQIPKFKKRNFRNTFKQTSMRNCDLEKKLLL